MLLLRCNKALVYVKIFLLSTYSWNFSVNSLQLSLSKFLNGYLKINWEKYLSREFDELNLFFIKVAIANANYYR